MENTTIQLNGKTFVLQFGMKVLRLLSGKWQIPKFSQIFNKLAIFEGMTDDLSFDQIDVINDIIVCAIMANPNNTETITSDELDEMYLQDPELFTKQVEVVFMGLMASFPQKNEEPGKKLAATKPKK